MTARFVVILLCFALAGCGKPMYPVKGRVHYPDGSPVTHGRVVLETQGFAGGVSGLIHPDGGFTLGTHTPDDGVPAGAYKVYFQNTDTFAPAGHIGAFTPRPLIHPKYAKAETSGLTLTVPVPDGGEWDITVEK